MAWPIVREMREKQNAGSDVAWAGCRTVWRLELLMRVAARAGEVPIQVFMSVANAARQIGSDRGRAQEFTHEDPGRAIDSLGTTKPLQHAFILGRQFVAQKSVIGLVAVLTARLCCEGAECPFPGPAPLRVAETAAFDLMEHPEVPGFVRQVTRDCGGLLLVQIEVLLKIFDQALRHGFSHLGR